MEAQIIEGTFSDIQRQILALPLKPDDRLRVIVTQPGDSSNPNDDHLAYPRLRNGLILVPTRQSGADVTTELVNELSEG